MKRFNQIAVCLLILSCLPIKLFAQLYYGNEWIDYSKTYYKFKVGKNGIYRISKAALDAAGIPSSTTGGQFILFKEGQEVPIYTTTGNSFGASDYIEFYGTKNDGKQDTELFGDPSIQANDRNSLFSDTASYYLCYDNQSNHSRYTSINNPFPSPLPAPASFCMVKVGNYYKDAFSEGYSYAPQYHFASSRFERGEGFLNYWIGGGGTANYTLATPNLVASGANAIYSAGLIAWSYYNQHNVKAYVNNQLYADSSYGPVDTKRFKLSIPASSLSVNAPNLLQFIPYNVGTSYDYWGVSFLELEYPRDFNVSGLNYFNFKLLASSSQYIEFQNFNTGGNSPKLYDLTNKKWYSGDISVSGKVRFYLDPSLSDRDMVLYAANSTNINNLNAVKTINFTDYLKAANQGNYIIVTHKALMDQSGHNYVQDYKNYRSSLTGGNYKVVIADVTELYDQFGYGIDIHPMCIKRFLKYAYDNWPNKPGYVFIIGRGLLYSQYPAYLANQSAYPYPIVPTYGDPGADLDFVNFGSNPYVMKMNIGRLSAWNGQEVGDYLEKVKSFEAAIPSSALPTSETELWKKTVLHIAGSSDAELQQKTLLPTLNAGAAILQDTAMGAMITTVAKNTTNPVDMIGSQTIDSMMNNGLSIITFHGHASSSGFDFNLNSPEQYHSAPRLPLFIALGCDVAQIFTLYTQKTISEKYLAASTGGAIAMLAADNLNFPNFHQYYLSTMYANIGQRYYGSTLGNQCSRTFDSLMSPTPYGNFYAHLESLLLQGDPAIKLFGPVKPDFHVNSNAISTIPAMVNTNVDSFKLKIVGYNLGRAVSDTVHLKVKHINPSGKDTTIGLYPIHHLFNTDTVLVTVPVDKQKDLGLNKYTVTIDALNKFDEISEANNTASVELFIYSDNLIPVYPTEFSIVNNSNLTLKASTLNPFRSAGRYKIEIDTTELFNSPSKKATTISAPSGVISWTPALNMQDSTVYYWRTAFDSAINGNYQWTNSSFTYLAKGSPGWNQSHYFQYQKDKLDTMALDNDRIFRFNQSFYKLEVWNTICYNSQDYTNCIINMNDALSQKLGCDIRGTIQIMVIDSTTGNPWPNNYSVTGAIAPCPVNRNVTVSEFSLYNQASRINAKKFIDSIPDGYYVLIKNYILNDYYTPSYVNSWIADTAVLGSGQSLYHSLKKIGFTMVDKVNDKRVFNFFCRKGRSDFPIYQAVNDTPTEVLHKVFYLPIRGTNGSMSSVVIGPAKDWQNLKWHISSKDTFTTKDSAYVRVIGIDTNSIEVPLYTGISRDTDISFINARQYPNIRLEWMSQDSIIRSSPQLDYWRVLFTPVPEAALNPAKYYSFMDSLNTGQMANFSVAIENISDQNMDSMLVKYKLIDANNTVRWSEIKRYKKLAANDTLHANFSFDPARYPGKNYLFIEANPDKDQPEQYHSNNLGYVPFKLIQDKTNPLMDVTFDGVHILNQDIVSSKPLIKIMLKDENQFQALDDTSMLSVYIRYPQDQPFTRRRVPFDGKTCKFIPANITDGGKNEAMIEYRPDLTQDSTYELFVSGHDKSKNQAGGKNTDYQIAFNVFNKSSITNILNYPNPFSTSTAFVFTVTGFQIPSQLKIQIMTVTGKVVREITKNELGPLHIGRNITEYKWDGKDQYGQLLGNGVYLYRVVTSLNGDDVEHRESTIDKYFKNGYGKMYIMR